MRVSSSEPPPPSPCAPPVYSEPSSLEAVTIDMSAAYIKTVTEATYRVQRPPTSR